MRHTVLHFILAIGVAVLAAVAAAQEAQPAGENAVQQTPYQSMTPEQRAAATRVFLGLGTPPDKAAAARGAPLFQQSCSFCHGPEARGATGPSLLTSDEVLGDDHGERLVAFLKRGRPEKGMPAYGTIHDEQLKDISEFLHLQVEEVANRGAYRILNILVGNVAKGQAYVAARCMSCHSAETFAHIGSRFRAPEQLQRGWIWPARTGNPLLEITATVKTQDGPTIVGRITQMSDFRITIVGGDGKTRTLDRVPGVEVAIRDPLAPHEKMIMTLRNEDMHDVTAYLESLK